MTLLDLHILRHRYARVPLSLAEAEVVWVDELLHFVLNLTRMQRHIFLGKELFFPVVVDLLVFNAADQLGLPSFVLHHVSIFAVLG